MKHRRRPITSGPLHAFSRATIGRRRVCGVMPLCVALLLFTVVTQGAAGNESRGSGLGGGYTPEGFGLGGGTVGGGVGGYYVLDDEAREPRFVRGASPNGVNAEEWQVRLYEAGKAKSGKPWGTI